jgi:hypothetical protein
MSTLKARHKAKLTPPATAAMVERLRQLLPEKDRQLGSLDEHQAARLLGYAPLTLRKWRQRGKKGTYRGPPYRKYGHTIRFPIDGLGHLHVRR